MWPLLVLTVLVAAIGLISTTAEVQRPATDELTSDAVAVNLLAYDRAAALFASQDPAFEGEIAPNQIAAMLPTGYVNLGGWRAHVQSRYMITVPTGALRFSPNVADALAHHTDGQLLVGRMSTRDESYAGPLTCWGFVSPQASCIPGTIFPSLITAYAARGAPIVLRKLGA